MAIGSDGGRLSIRLPPLLSLFSAPSVPPTSMIIGLGPATIEQHAGCNGEEARRGRARGRGQEGAGRGYQLQRS